MLLKSRIMNPKASNTLTIIAILRISFQQTIQESLEGEGPSHHDWFIELLPKLHFLIDAGGWKQFPASLFHSTATSALPQSACKSSGSGKWPYKLIWLVPVGKKGLQPENQFNRMWHLHLEDWGRLRGFHQLSALYDMYDCPWQWTRLAREVSWP